MSIRIVERKDLFKIDYHPLFIDFDFIKSKPRGASVGVDFFALGGLCVYMDNLSDSKVVYINKKDLIFENGFFLVDFAKLLKNIDFSEIISGMNINDRIYIENSPKYDMEKIISGLDIKQIFLVNFI